MVPQRCLRKFGGKEFLCKSLECNTLLVRKQGNTSDLQIHHCEKESRKCLRELTWSSVTIPYLSTPQKNQVTTAQHASPQVPRLRYAAYTALPKQSHPKVRQTHVQG